MCARVRARSCCSCAYYFHLNYQMLLHQICERRRFKEAACSPLQAVVLVPKQLSTVLVASVMGTAPPSSPAFHICRADMAQKRVAVAVGNTQVRLTGSEKLLAFYYQQCSHNGAEALVCALKCPFYPCPPPPPPPPTSFFTTP